MNETAFVVKGDKPSVLFKWTGKATGVVIPGVRAGDINEYHWAAMSPHQRLRVERIAAKKDGAYATAGKVPAAPNESPPVASTASTPSKDN